MHIFFNFFFALQFSYPSPTAFYKPSRRTFSATLATSGSW